MLKIAIQAKGRLNEDTMRLLADAGIRASGGSRKLLTRAKGFPTDLLFLRDDDIPQAVAMGVADIGVVGLNEVLENDCRVEQVARLGFGACRLALAIPKGTPYTGLGWFDGRRVATSYPRILAGFFDSHDIRAEIHEIAGSVEVAPAVGMADAIFDIVSSGDTLVQNGLVEVETAVSSEAVLIATPGLPPDKRAELDKLRFRFDSVTASRGMKYVVMNLPRQAVERAVAILPGMKSPTVLPLADPAWAALHVVIRDDELWEKIEQLKEAGAEDILVVPLENIIR